MPWTFFGAVLLVALLAAYLADCLPGFGSGGGLGTPSSDAPASKQPAAKQPAAKQPEAAGRIAITVQGEQCRRDQAPAAPCSEVCGALPRHETAAVVEIDATEGRHGTVEDLRKCLVQAGFANVRIHSE